MVNISIKPGFMKNYWETVENLELEKIINIKNK